MTTWKQLLEYATVAGVKNDDVIDSMQWDVSDGHLEAPEFNVVHRWPGNRTPGNHTLDHDAECPSADRPHTHWRVI